MGEEEKTVEEVVVDVAVEEEGVEVEVEVEASVEGGAEGAAEGAEKKPKKTTSETLKDALKQVETFGQALSDALTARGNVVMVRVNDQSLEHLDMLVEAEVTKSRSESAAFLISAGVKANADLFGRISTITQQISELREQLRKEVNLIPEPKVKDVEDSNE